MEFGPLDIDALMSELVEIRSHCVDATARHVHHAVAKFIPLLRAMPNDPTADDLAGMLADDPFFLDCCRLFLGVSQETAAHLISQHLGRNTRWPDLRKRAKVNPEAVAHALAAMGLPRTLREQIERPWSVEDVLVDRYTMSRGRAIAGQLRGRALEDEVAKVLEGIVPFEKRVTFVGREGRKAKCDIAIPHKNRPKIVIEAKGFEATGSKLTDFLGDIGKIIEAKESRMYFFVVTDGRGWLNRKSDLGHVVERQHQKYVDMVYTLCRLDELKRHVEHIWKYEFAADADAQ